MQSDSPPASCFSGAVPVALSLLRKKTFLQILTASIIFAAFRRGIRPPAVLESGGLYDQSGFRLWQFLLGMWCASWNTERRRIFMAVVLDWNGCGMAACFFLRREKRNQISELFVPGIYCSFRAFCIVHIFSVEHPAAFPVKKTAEMGEDWRRNDLCPFSVPHTVMRGMSKMSLMWRETCGDGLAGS